MSFLSKIDRFWTIDQWAEIYCECFKRIAEPIWLSKNSSGQLVLAFYRRKCRFLSKIVRFWQIVRVDNWPMGWNLLWMFRTHSRIHCEPKKSPFENLYWHFIGENVVFVQNWPSKKSKKIGQWVSWTYSPTFVPREMLIGDILFSCVGRGMFEFLANRLLNKKNYTFCLFPRRFKWQLRRVNKKFLPKSKNIASK